MLTIELPECVLLRTKDVLAHPEHGGVRIIGEDGISHPPMVAPRPGKVGKVAFVAVKSEEAVSPVGRRDDLLREPIAGRLQKLEMEEEVVREEILFLFAGRSGLPEAWNSRMMASCASQDSESRRFCASVRHGMAFRIWYVSMASRTSYASTICCRSRPAT